jgi:hypothetical protein
MASRLRPTTGVASYTAVLLFLFLVGVIENHVDSEGMGFLPLLVLTTPWSWLLISTWDASIWGNGPHAEHLAIFVTCNIVAGTVNGYGLYLLLRWRKRR